MKMMLMAWLALGSFAMTSTSPAQRVPLPMERLAPVYDEFQRPLCRNAGDLVHVLAVGAGIQPPNPFSGEPHPDNAILMATKVGAGINPKRAACGFAVAITPRPDVSFFVRVYNAPTTGEATFYEDSAIFTPSLTVDEVFYPQLTATTNPVNAALTADGLSVSMKQSLGLNPYTADSDGDGIADADELRMGTDALSAASLMPPLMVVLDRDGRMNAFWEVAGTDRVTLNAAGLSEIQQAEIASIFGDASYRIEQSSYLGHAADWEVVPGSEKRVSEKWPPEVVLPAAPGGAGFFRMMMEP
jgi:hypothetical protein